MQAKDARRGSGHGRVPQVLVERERELAALDRVLERARSGNGGALLLEGRAGLGKSALLAETAARARTHGMAVLHARAQEGERAFPFAVALQLFEAPLTAAETVKREALLAGAAGLARPLLSGLTVDDGRRPASSFSNVHGLYWVLVNLTRSGPVLLVVDDAHWSDEGSARLLRYLAGRLDELPVALALAVRPRSSDEAESLAALRTDFAAHRVCLRALEPSGVGSLVRASLKGADEAFCRVCTEVTNGNPFHLRQLLLALAEEQIPPTADSVARLRSLGGALLGKAAVFRLVRLGPDAIALARATAVLGDGAPLRRAAALAQLEFEPAALAADALIAEEILSATPNLAFAHPLIRTEIYSEIPPGQRGIAHLRAARLLADEPATPELVASQLLLAPPSGDVWVVEMLRHAARRARAQAAPESAARYLQRALEEPPPPEERARLLVELGASEAATGTESAVGHLELALELEPNRGARATAASLLSRALTGLGRAWEAARVLERALDEADKDDDNARCALLADYLTSTAFEPGLRQRAIERAAPLLQSAPEGSTPAQRSLLAALAMRSGQEGELAGRTIELADRAWSGGVLLADDGPEGPGWLMVDWAFELAEDYERAKAVTAATIEAARSAGSLHAFANASYFHGDACYRQGRLLEAQADAEQAIETARSGWRRYLVAALVLKVNVLLDRGELQAAEQTLVTVEDHETGNMLEVAWRLHARGRLDLACARPEQALERFEAAGRWVVEQLAAEHTMLPWRVDAAEAALTLGDHERARTLVESGLGHAERFDMDVRCGRRLRLLGLIEGGEHGIRLLERSVATLAGTQAALEHAQALTDLGSALRRARRRADARSPLRESLDIAHRLGAARLGQRAREELLASGARPRRASISGAESLTPSERRVAELAASGMTNPRIAQALFVTPKTVEFHLRHVYQKLAIDGRAGLAAALPTFVPPTIS